MFDRPSTDPSLRAPAAVGSAAWTDDPPLRAGIRLFTAFQRWLFGLRLPIFCLLILTVVVLQNGVWIVPIIKFLCHLSSDVTRQLTRDDPEADYHYTSFLGLLLGYWTGAWRSALAFALLHLAFLGVGLACLLRVVYRRFGDETVRLFALSIATVPLSNVLLTWLEMPDVYVFVFSTGLVLAEGAPLLALLAFLLGLAHFEQGLLIVIGLSIYRIYHKVHEGKHGSAAALAVAAMLGGVLGARLLLARYFVRQGFHLSSTRFSFFSAHHLVQMVRDDAHHFGTLCFSWHGCYWLVVAAATYSLWQTRRGLAMGFIGIQVALAAVSLATLDETRVFSLLVWPFLVLILRPDVAPLGNLRGYVVAAYLGGLIVPKLIVWEGIVHSSTLYDGLVLLGRLVAGRGVPTDPLWMLQPFR